MPSHKFKKYDTGGDPDDCVRLPADTTYYTYTDASWSHATTRTPLLTFAKQYKYYHYASSITQ
jgi:hypothetical protein